MSSFITPDILTELNMETIVGEYTVYPTANLNSDIWVCLLGGICMSTSLCYPHQLQAILVQTI